jgi:hypothetical protein
VEDFLANRVVFPHQLSGFLIDRDDRWRFRGGNVDVAFVLTV